MAKKECNWYTVLIAAVATDQDEPQAILTEYIEQASSPEKALTQAFAKSGVEQGESDDYVIYEGKPPRMVLTSPGYGSRL